MKKGFLLAALLAATLCTVLICPAGVNAVEITADNYSGWTIYREDEDIGNTNISGEADAFYNRTTLALTEYDNKGIEGEIRWGMGVTSVAAEKWEVNSVEFQKNKLSLMDMDMGILLGWGVPLGEFFGKSEIAITPLAGYRYKWTRFRRRDFVVWQVITVTETIDEVYNIQSIDVGGRFNVRVDDKYNIYAKPIFGIVVFNSATNSALGEIEGQGGFFFNCDVGLEYPISENFMLGLAFRTELQHLRGGEKAGVIWPDNSQYTFGGDISLTYRF